MRLGVILPDEVGLSVLALPIYQCLKKFREFNDVVAVPVCPNSQRFAEFAAGRSAIDRWVPWEEIMLQTVIKGPIDARLAAALDDCDRVILFPFWPPKYGRGKRVVRDRVRACTRTPVYDARMPETGVALHWTERLRQRLGDQGMAIDRDLTPPRIDIGSMECDRNRIVISPGSGDFRKWLPVERWFEFADFFVERNYDVHWLLGPRELKSPHFEPVFDRPEPVIMGGNILDDMLSVQGARLFIGPDAGMSHVAAACGMNTVFLIGQECMRVRYCPRNENVFPIVFEVEQHPTNPLDGRPREIQPPEFFFDAFEQALEQT
ncbi:MAG TPA: glycosyltransferase family 9 protein [Phycisphaerae bacterium]|nr:glycosyltransferase family 9 protein [Phycisphaerae bacterium]